MATVLAIGRGPRIIVLDAATGASDAFDWGPDLETAAQHRAEIPAAEPPAKLIRHLTELPSSTRVLAAGHPLAAALSERTARPVGVANEGELREARDGLPGIDPSVDRRFVLAVAARKLERALRAPEEVLIALAREEDRLERAVGREARASEAFPAVAGTPLETYAAEWGRARAALAAHHGNLRARLEGEARRVLPNLSSVVGPRVAARLLAAAGGSAALARMSAPRLQLLGARRRPSPDHGPRYGLIYRAERMEDVPAGRRAAFARSLAALAVIAARADATTHRDLTPVLIARRDRRIEQLRRARA